MSRKFVWTLPVLLLALVLGPAVLPASAQRESHTLQAPGSLIDPAEIAVPANRPDVSREAVTFTWALDPAQEIRKDEPTYPVAYSRQYWLRVTPEELRAGVALPTTSAGALVRVQSFDADGNARPVDIDALRVATPAGDQLARGAAMDLLVDAEKMDAASTMFASGTAAFRLRGDLGAGEFVVSGDLDVGEGQREDPGADIDWVLFHVFEPNSDAVVALAANQGHFLHNNVARFTVELQAEGVTSVAQIDGFLTAPSGQAWPVIFTPAADGAFVARVPLDASGEAGYRGLWQVEAVVEGEADGQRVRRAVHTAFAVALPTARLTNVVRQNQGDASSVDVGVEVAVEGRYEVRALIYGTNAEGQLLPLAASHSAAWLEAGQGTLVLPVDAQALAREGFAAPYEVRDLRLIDQGRMSLLQEQSRGPRFDR